MAGSQSPPSLSEILASSAKLFRSLGAPADLSALAFVTAEEAFDRLECLILSVMALLLTIGIHAMASYF